MYVIGLTGGIACGKSTVSKILMKLGAVIIDADEVAHKLALPHQPLWQKFVEHFGEAILLDDGSLNRKKIGAIVFADEAERRWMDDMAHPLIEAEIKRQLDLCQANKVRIVVLDVPLLYETQWDKLANENWVVYINEDTQLARLMQRNDMPELLARQRIASQMPLGDKVKRADVVIDNMGDEVQTNLQVQKRWREIERRADDV